MLILRAAHSAVFSFAPLLILQSFIVGFISYMWFKTCSEDKYIYFVQAFVWCLSLEGTSDSYVLFLLQPWKSLPLSFTDDKRFALILRSERYMYRKSETSGTWAGIVDSTIHYSVDSKHNSLVTSGVDVGVQHFWLIRV